MEMEGESFKHEIHYKLKQKITNFNFYEVTVNDYCECYLNSYYMHLCKVKKLEFSKLQVKVNP